MSLPVYKIETYTGAVLDHTITDDCWNIQVIMALTDQLSNFTFIVPAMKDAVKSYDDIAAFDKVKIWLAWDSVPATALFVGRVENIQNILELEKYVRVVSGHDLGEVTNRRIRHQYSTGGGQASVNVAKWAADLGLATDITADATAVSIVSNQTKYDSLMRDIGDYAATINKDWYVYDNAGTATLLWKTRPLRTVGVSTFTVGTNIKSYNLVRDINEVFNRFYVFGASEPAVEGTSACACSQYAKSPTDLPTDHDSWTEAIGSWSVDSADDMAVLDVSAVSPHVGTNEVLGIAIQGDGHQANEWIQITRTLPVITVKDSARLEWVDYWHHNAVAAITSMEIFLLAPDTSNYFHYYVAATNYPAEGTHTHMHAELGPAQEAITGDEKWVRVGNPSWYNIQGIAFLKLWDNVVTECVETRVDGLYFTGLRWYDYDNDAGSEGSYGIRECVITDERIHSNTEASNYAATWKAQKKDAALQLDIITPLDTNILVGDRIPITIVNENLAAVDFDVIRVKHSIGMDGAWSHPTLISRERQRSPLKTTDTATILRELQRQSTNIVDGRNIVK